MQTILTVEDSASMRQIVAYTLKASGFKVIEAVDGVDGLSKASAPDAQIDLVLTDQNMPRMDGITLVATLRQLPRYSKTPMLLLTTESSQELREKGRSAGATGWLVKPFDPERLIEVIRKVI